jgi:hypothetical protein
LNRPVSYNIQDNAVIGIQFKSSGSNCKIRLWYWLTSNLVGSLNIYMRSQIGDTWVTLDMFNQATSGWTKIEALIAQRSSPFQVLLMFS